MKVTTYDEEAIFDQLLLKFWVDRKIKYRRLARQLIASGEVVTNSPLVICRYTYSNNEAGARASFDGGVRYPVGLHRPIYELDRYEFKRIYFDMAWLDASIQMYLIDRTD